ncbi:MAG: DDE-type integrase/transposase/recombinase [Nitrososphaerales archaeon]
MYLDGIGFLYLLRSLFLSFSGLSYRGAVAPFFVSHESVRLWCIRIAGAIPRPERKLREKVAVDESKLKLRGYLFFIWIARDVNTKEILSIRVSYKRSSLDAYLFLKDVMRYCEKRPRIVVDKGPYTWALEELLEYEYKRFGMRNRVGIRNHKEKNKAIPQQLP